MAGCLSRSPQSLSAASAGIPRLKESFITSSRVADNTDSAAIFAPSQGEPWAIVTQKSGHLLSVYRADTGEFLRDIGKMGTEAGAFQRPNGVLVIDDLCLVIERDNHRVQVMQLPEFTPLGMIGASVLIKPYGGTVHPVEAGYHLYVTDDFPIKGGQRNRSAYTQRVKQFRFHVDQEGHVQSELVRAFGDTEGEGRLDTVESILADPVYNRLLIANETGRGAGIKVYSLDGTFTGTVLPTQSFLGEPEGLALYAKGAEDGYIVTTDQQPRISVFSIFDRKTLAFIGRFAGEVTANTDGIAVYSGTTGTWSQGGLWAIHDDQALSGFRWEAIEALLQGTP
jgi:3-phytase